jgi:chromosome segregation ATPase
MAANTSRINLTIGGIQEAKKQLDELKSAIEQTENKAEKNKLTKSYKELEKEVKNATKAFDELDSSGKRLTSRFDEIYGDIQPLSGRIGELEDRLYELFLAGEQNSEEFKTITGEVARMKKVIIEVDKSVDLLAENQGISVFSSGISQIGERLLALDFVGAEKDAKALNSSIGNLSKMGSQAIKGMVGTVVQLSRAFMSMGAALLANPIFLIAAAIVAIVTIIGVLLNKLGLLKPILNAIGKAFEFVKSVIDAVVQSIKDFLDWLGLTSFAAEEAAGRQAAAQEKVAKAFEDKRNKVVSAYDQEIALAQIAGEDTVDLERKKQQAIIETSRAQYRALEAQRDALRAQGVLTAEQSKSINESMRTLREGIEGARKQIELINAKEVADNKKKTDTEETKRQADVAAERR